MTLLHGFRCDTCGVESADKPGDWHQVQATKVTHNGHGIHGGVSFMWSDGLHFCSKECLVASTEKWKTR